MRDLILAPLAPRAMTRTGIASKAAWVQSSTGTSGVTIMKA